MEQEDKYKFKLSFKGQLVENSVDAFDVANTILATSQAFQEVSGILYNDVQDSLKININAFTKGSLITEFVVLIDQGKIIVPTLIIATPQIITVGREVLTTIKTFIEIRKALKGKPPKEVKATANGLISIIGDNNQVILNVTPNILRTLQDKAVSRNIAKSVEPLLKEGSLLDEIEIYDEDDIVIGVTKEEAEFLRGIEDFQILPAVKYKGVVSKIDTKARSGYLSIQSKRLAFTYPKNLPIDKFTILVDSLKTKVQIYLVGEVSMDYEGNPRNMTISDVESDSTLFS